MLQIFTAIKILSKVKKIKQMYSFEFVNGLEQRTKNLVRNKQEHH